MSPYLYETHLHTSPVSKCAKASVRDNLTFYKEIGYTGVFITNHFFDAPVNRRPNWTYEEMLDFYFSDYEEGVRIGKEIGLQVFFGIECTHRGTDFLIYGLDKAWLSAHPEIIDMKKTQMLPMMAEAGALIIQAHPFREASYIDHIRLFPRVVHGVEIYNACRTDFENAMAKLYAENYGLLPFSGTDNHVASKQKRFGGMQADTPLLDELDFVQRVKNGEMHPFHRNAEQ